MPESSELARGEHVHSAIDGGRLKLHNQFVRPAGEDCSSYNDQAIAQNRVNVRTAVDQFLSAQKTRFSGSGVEQCRLRVQAACRQADGRCSPDEQASVQRA